MAYLPTIKVTGAKNPVVQVVHESNGEVVYTLRIKGDSFRPKVFSDGNYTVHVDAGKKRQTLKGVKSIGLNAQDERKVSF